MHSIGGNVFVEGRIDFFEAPTIRRQTRQMNVRLIRGSQKRDQRKAKAKESVLRNIQLHGIAIHDIVVNRIRAWDPVDSLIVVVIRIRIEILHFGPFTQGKEGRKKKKKKGKEKRGRP